MNIPLLRGREVQKTDNLQSPGVVVINDWFARHYWPGEDPIGKRITLDDPRQNPTWLTVVGVAKNTVRGQWSAPPEEEIFLPYRQKPKAIWRASQIWRSVIRAKGNPANLASTIQAEIRALGERRSPSPRSRPWTGS